MTGLRQSLEKHQVSIYFGAVVAAAAAAMAIPELEALEAAINPALAVMLLVTFLQVPLGELSRALGQIRFMAALLLANFVAIPLLVTCSVPPARSVASARRADRAADSVLKSVARV